MFTDGQTDSAIVIIIIIIIVIVIIIILFYEDTPLQWGTQKEITSQTDNYLVISSSKSYVFEDNLTKY